MRILPNSTVKIYNNVKVDDDMTLVFSSAANREAYFAKHVVASFNAQVVRKTGELKFPLKLLNGASLDRCNYLSFQNPAYDNKLFYARIIGKEYVNNETALITYGVDRWMSRMFEVDYHDMFIDREHVSTQEAEILRANPYDPRIAEMRTAETGLSYDKSLQKRLYSLNAPTDMFKMGESIIAEYYHVPYGTTHYYDILYMSDINFDAFTEIETGLDKSLLDYWNEMLESYQEGGENRKGFLFRPDTTVAEGEPMFFESETQITPVKPMWANAMSHPYWVLGFYTGIDGGEPPEHYNIKTWLKYLNQAGLTNTVLGIYSVPAHLLPFILAGRKPITETPMIARIEHNGEDTVKADYANADPKLFQFPFAYMTATTPNGDIKEYHYEEFLNNMKDNSGEWFVLGGELSESPKISMKPLNYKMAVAYDAGDTASDVNPFEGVEYDKFPTVAYDNDAWTAQMAAIASANVMNYTAESAQALYFSQTYETGGMGFLRNFGTMMGSTVDASWSKSIGADGGSTSISAGGGQVNPVTGALDFAGRANQQIIQEIRNDNFTAANNLLAGQKADNAMYNNYRNTRPAFAANIYNKSSGDGVSNYNMTSFIDFLITHVRLDATVLKRYTQYFDCFGYASERCGLPHVLGYTKGTDEPAWRRVDGDLCTYVKTRDAKVIAYDSDTANAIKTMLDAGIRMIKGDGLA